MLKINSAWILSAVIVTGCGVRVQQKNDTKLHEAWDERNDPSEMDYDYLNGAMNYSLSFDDLPLRGKLSTTPWSDNYSPTYRGGITNRWALDDGTDASYAYDIEYTVDEETIKLLSPAEKYDIFLGAQDMPLTNYERSRTQVMRTVETCPLYDATFSIPTWEGLCHAWAPATLAFKEPRPVVLTNPEGIKVEFGSSDVKALLTYFLHLNTGNQRSRFLGGRCNDSFSDARQKLNDGEITEEQYLALVNSSACKDVNAGSFHVVLANQIGKNDEGFVFDVTRDAEVWNQPVYSYSSKIISETMGASRTAAVGTVKEVQMETRVGYIVEVGESFEPSNEGSHASKTFYYTLEIDADGQIIGGEWDEQKVAANDRPDFLWKRDVPEFVGFFEKLKEIYLASIAQ